MLIEFSVSNYRSFREKQTLSMVAASRLGKKRNVFDPKLPGDDLPKLLKVAAIYGPNASGKSSLVKALNVISSMLRTSPVENGLIPVQPFRFDKELSDKPSCFETNFVHDGLRFQFILATTSERIFEETLICYPRGKESLLYSRKYTPGLGEIYSIGDLLEGGEVVHDAWKKLTGPKTLFLAQAVLNSSEDLKQLKSPYEWFRTSTLCIAQDGMSTWSVLSRSMVMQNSKYKEFLQNFLQRVDVPITKIRFEEMVKSNFKIGPSAHFDDHLKAVEENARTKLTHTTLLGEAEFDFEEESGGTQNLMGFWLPWMKLNTVDVGGVVIVDELDSSLHPKIVENLVQSHLESETNSQLIFTTHDTHLMNTKLLRRDQYWVTERDANGATQMFSVHDFQGRDSEDIEKRYFEGRYRGLPILTRG
jgi:AAA15 family ATPase/GTPase